MPTARFLAFVLGALLWAHAPAAAATVTVMISGGFSAAYDTPMPPLCL